MAFRILVAIADSVLAESTRALIDEADGLDVVATATSAEATLEACSEFGVDAALVHQQIASASNPSFLRTLVDRHPHIGVVLVVSESTPEIMRAALQAGARGIVTLPIALDDIHDELSAAAGWSRSVADTRAGAVAAETRRGTLVAISGAKGGVGATTVACQLAARLVGDDGPPPGSRSVCLVDLDLQTGDIPSLLNISHHRHVLDLIDVAFDMTQRHLDETLYVHRSGLHVLLGPDEGEFAEDVGAGPTRQILQGLRSTFDVVVADVGSVLTEGGAMAIELADIALVVVTPDVPALRAANRELDMWERLNVRSADSVHVVVNRASRMTDVQPDLVDRIVRARRVQTTIPADFGGIEAASNAGAFDAPVAAVGKSISSMAEELGLTNAQIRRESNRSAGQASIEMIGLLTLILMLMFALWQFTLAGYTFVLTSHAAREASRELAVHVKAESVREIALDDVPDAWRADAVVDVNPEAAEVIVSLQVPIIVPGMSSPFTISSTSGTVMERAS